jgi:hypothetical protein
MVRVQFAPEEDRIKGNYLLATRSVIRRLRGQVFEVAECDLKLPDGYQLRYTLVRTPGRET